MYGNAVNAGPQRPQTFPAQGGGKYSNSFCIVILTDTCHSAIFSQSHSKTVYPNNGPNAGLRIPEGAEFLGIVDGLPLVSYMGTMGQVEWINDTHHCHFKPLEAVHPFQQPIQQPGQQPPPAVQYSAYIPHAMHGYPAQQLPAMLPAPPVQQIQNGFPVYPGFPFPNAPIGHHPSSSTGFVPTVNGQATGFVPMANGQVRGTPSMHIPNDTSPQSVKMQQQALNAQYESCKRELHELERYAALHNDEFTPMQNIEIINKRRALVSQLDETRKKKLQLDRRVVSNGRAAALSGPSGRGSSKSRQVSKSRGQAPLCSNIFEVAQAAIGNDDQQKELHKTAKKFSPDAPVFVPAASTGFCGTLDQKLLEGPSVTDVALRIESPIVLPADASYCDKLGFNNPSEPKQFCTEPQEFIIVIKAAHEQARRYGCEGGQSKDPEWDAEQDIRWAMQDELPIPLAPETPEYVSNPRPWNWADSYFNVRKYRAANWLPPRYIQAPKVLPLVRSGRFSRQQSVDGGVPLFRAQSVPQHTASAHSSGRSSALTVVGRKNNQASYDEGSNRVNLAAQKTKTEVMGGNSEEHTQAQLSQLDSKLSEMNLALLNSHDVSQASSALLRASSRYNSTDSSLITNVSQEKAKTKEQIQFDTERLYKKAGKLFERYATELQQNPELVDALEPLAQLARIVKQNRKGKARSPRNDYEDTTETIGTDRTVCNDSPIPLFVSSKNSPQRFLEDSNSAAASLIDKTNNELKAVLVAPEPKLVTKSMTKRQAGQFARNLIANKSQEQGESFSSNDKAAETPKSDAQRRLLAHLNFANGDENRPFDSTSANMMYKARSSIASPTFEARGLVHSSASMEVQPSTPVEPRNRNTEYDLGLMRKAAYLHTKDWANEGFRNPGTRSSKKQNLPAARASDDHQEQKLTRAQRYQARHGFEHGHGTTEW